jgi:hypothetical protein
MNQARRMFLATLMCLTVAAAVWAVPTPQQKPMAMSGKISSIQKAGQGTLQDSFTLDLPDDSTIPFFMVPQTKVTGPFKIGSMADVTYVFDKDGNKVAVTIAAK